MDNYAEISEVYRKASLASIRKVEFYEKELSEDLHKPRDTLFLVHLLCLLFGVLNMLPLTFFVVANDYWMYKFRDTSKDTIDLNHKTTLQKYFVSGTTVVQTVPSILTMLLAASLGHKFKVHSRIFLTLFLQTSVFVIFTIFIKVDTDTWQTAFFVMTLAVLSLITGFVNLFQVSSLVVVSKFPSGYMKTFLFGQGMASIFNPTLQIISLALGTSTETSAIFYFVTGAALIFGTLVLHIFIQNMAFYRFYMQIQLEDTKRKYSKEEIKQAFFQIWPVVAMLSIILLTMSMTHPSITSLVVSEGYGKTGSQWNDLYFVPVVTFLFGEICSQFGRLMARPIITKSSGPWFVGLTLLRMLILIPLVMLSNAQPRNYLPVVLKHDWEYVLMLVVYFSTSGFLLSSITLSIPKLAPENEEVAYLVMLSGIGIAAGSFSPFSLLAVRII